MAEGARNMLKRVLYVSDSLISSVAQTSRGEISRLLDLSRRNNEASGITGALLWSSGYFAQAIEGEAEPLAQVFERILRDQRHRNIDVLQFSTIEERAFADWSMAYVERHGTNAAATPQPTDIPRDAANLLSYLRSLVTQIDR
jgi:hypothetical protein